MGRKRANDAGRFGIQPVDGVIDLELTTPTLQSARSHLGLSESFIREATDAIEKCDEEGRNFILDPSDLSNLGLVRENADSAISKLGQCLAHMIRTRDICHNLIEHIATGKAADVTVSQ